MTGWLDFCISVFILDCWPYLGNEKSYRRSAGVKTAGFFRAFQISKKRFFGFLAIPRERRELPEIRWCQNNWIFRDFQLPAWVTRPERRKGVKDEVKKTEGPPTRSWSLEGPRLLVFQYLSIAVWIFPSPSPLPIFVVLLLPWLTWHPLAPGLEIVEGYAFVWIIYLWMNMFSWSFGILIIW